MGELVWKGKQVLTAARKNAGVRLQIAGRMLRDHIKRQSSETLPSQQDLPWWTDATGAHHQYAGSEDSYPFKRTGDFRKSVAMSFEEYEDTLVVRIGSTIEYAKWLELGTRNMAPRPWLTLGLTEMWSEMKGVFGQ